VAIGKIRPGVYSENGKIPLYIHPQKRGKRRKAQQKAQRERGGVG